MKKILCSFSVLVMLIFSTSVGAQTWKSLGAAGFSPGNAQSTAMVIAPNGTPYVVYQDGLNGSVTVKKYSGEGWVTVGSEDFSSGAAYFTSLAINSGGTPYVAFEDGSKGNRATVKKFNGTGWVSVGAEGFSDASVQYTSIAIDGGGTPYVVYQDGNDTGKFKATVMKYDSDSSKWLIVGNRWFSRTQTFYTSIAIDSWGTPYVVFEDGVNGSATVMNFNGSNWQTVGNPSFSAGRVAYPSIAIGRQGQPVVAYLDGANASKATVMMYDFYSGWSAVGNEGFTTGQAYYPSLALDRFGTPYVAYSDNSDSNRATVMTYDGYNDEWKTVGKAGFSSDWVWSPSIVIDSNDVPYVVYSDLGAYYKATVMKLDQSATAIANVVDPLKSAFNIFPNPNRGCFCINIFTANPENAMLTVTNILGEKVKEYSVGTNENMQIDLNSPPGIYFISVQTLQGKRNAKVVVQ